MPSIFVFPEIAIAISHYLNRHDLYNCVLVNSSWLQSFTPCLWRTVQFTIPTVVSQPPQVDCVLEQALILNNRHIRSLRSNSLPFVTMALTHCSHLLHLHIPLCKQFLMATPEFINGVFLPAMQRNPELRTLVHKGFPIPPTSPLLSGGAAAMLQKMLEPLRSLTYLDLCFAGLLDHTSLLYLARFAKQLHSLIICVSLTCKDEASNGQEQEHTMDLESTQLRQLEVRATIPKEDPTILIQLLKASPHLEILSFPYYDGMLVAQIIRQYCSRLRCLKFEQTGDNYRDDEMAAIVNSCQTSGLQLFSSNERLGLGHRTIRALYANSATLDTVKIPIFGYDTFITVQRLLSSCPNLRELRVSKKLNSPSNIGKFPARELLMDPWICERLEVLQLPIEMVHGGAVRGGNQANDPSVEPGDYHQKLYVQLGKLLWLQKLDLSFKQYLYNTTCKTSPLFSLDSGLEILEGLKQLEVLDLSGTANDIKRPELEWMCEHWPMLTQIRGSLLDSWITAAGDKIVSEGDALALERVSAILVARGQPVDDIYD